MLYLAYPNHQHPLTNLMVEMFHTTLVEAFPVTEQELRMQRGWGWGWQGREVHPELIPYAHRGNEITVHHGVLNVGKYNIRSNQTEKESFGNISRGLKWYGWDEGLVLGVRSGPNIDKDIKGPVQNCEGCQEIANNPARAPLHRWEYPALPWQRLHIDFSGRKVKRKKKKNSYKRNLYRLNFVMLSLRAAFPVEYGFFFS